MTFVQAFYLYILPLSISVIGGGWLIYDSWRERRNKRLHPEE